MNSWFALAALLAFVVAAIHSVVGSRYVAGPLLRSSLHPVAKYTNYYCWHIVTIVLFAMAAGFARAAFSPRSDLAWLFTGLAAAFSGWNIALVLWRRQSPVQMPQWALFLAVASAGALGLWSDA